MKGNKRCALLLAAAMLLTLLAGCGGGGKADAGGDTQEISWWIGSGEDSRYYMSYEENPAVKYLETLEFNGKKMDLSFVAPIAGSELDNFNTLLMTDEYCDIMDMSYSTTYPVELLSDGYIWDLTPYMEQYMPNYMSVLASYPELDPYTYSVVDGEKKILCLYGITAEINPNFKGYLYRRDWVSKYGTNPETGVPFTYGYTDPENPNTYYDDVVFPSGETDPVYISDWEWMFEIFTKAMADLGITDGYCYSPYYKVYGEDGSLNAAFGGGTGMWYKNQEDKAAFGGADESMRTYLECLNTWYEKGWVDKNFAEHTADAAYAVDSAKVHQGKVGLWCGRTAETSANMDTGEYYTDGIMVWGARIPINDVYGSDAVKNKTPYSLYQKTRLRGGSVVLTTKITEEELPTVLTFLDFLYTREGGTLTGIGLSKEQFEATQDEFYIRNGLTDGAYWVKQEADGTYVYGRSDVLLQDNTLNNPVAGKRLGIGYSASGVVQGAARNPDNIIANHAFDQWDFYVNTGFPDKALRTQFTPDESNTYGKVYANVDSYMSSMLPKFVTGDLDIHEEKAWNDYCKMLNKYGPDKVTAIYQRVFDSVK